MTRADTTQRILEAGAIAIVRLPSTRHLIRVAEAIVHGGVTVMEVTLTTPNALAATRQLVQRLSERAVVGVGSVLFANDVARAAECGARFIVSPVSTPALIESAHAHDLPVIPGALTPSEVYQAQARGADLIKVFPAGFWGSKYIRALLAPMPDLRLCPTGGVTPENAGEWIAAGALAVGIGSALASAALAKSGNFEEITQRAQTLVRSIQAVRRQN